MSAIHIHWSIVLAKIDLVSLYFRLLWYHSILKGSIDQYNKIHSPLACSRWLTWFPDLSRPYVACVKHGSGETYVRSLRSKSAVKSIPTSVPCWAKKYSNIPSPGRSRLVKCPTPGATKTIKSPPHAIFHWPNSLEIKYTLHVWGFSFPIQNGWLYSNQATLWVSRRLEPGTKLETIHNNYFWGKKFAVNTDNLWEE